MWGKSPVYLRLQVLLKLISSSTVAWINCLAPLNCVYPRDKIANFESIQD